MSDPVRDLYQTSVYPAMSHPSCDPSTTTVAAKLAGLTTPDPSGSTILEIGCATGHNLLPLAARWPNSRFIGIDLSSAAIRTARETAAAAHITNVEFIEADLATFNPSDVSYDFIIAHGVYSWVPDQVRKALMDFIPRHLSRDGVATVSYNTLPGWSQRQTVVDLVRRLGATVAALEGASPVDILTYLTTIEIGASLHAEGLRSVLYDMIQKSGDILLYDDFGPTNHAVTFLDFIDDAQRSGLKYLGESQLSANYPTSLPDESRTGLQPLAAHPMLLQQTIDVLTNRTFRSSILCRADAPVEPKLTTATALHFAVRILHAFERTPTGGHLLDAHGQEKAHFEHPLAVAFFSALAAIAPEAVPTQEVMERIAAIPEAKFDPTTSLPPLAALILDAARRNLIELRSEPVRFDNKIPQFPKLGTLHRRALERNEALVDIYHVPCSFPASKKPVLRAMDGTRNVDELAALAHVDNPALDFRAWISHLAKRGIFR
jgi:SAM-dependent methyltransferase